MQVGHGLVVVAAMVVLAALDIVGSLCAKEFADHHRPLALALGAVVFVLLFVVYALALQVAQLSIVTLGWIVLLQVGLLALDARQFGLNLHVGQWLAVVAVIGLQCYLVVSTSGVGGAGAEHEAVRPRSQARPPVHTTPALYIDLDVVAERHAELSAALPEFALHYAAKANPAPEVLSLLAGRGAAFDVASPAEIVACLQAGAAPADLSYGNTVKKAADIGFAYEQGVRLFTFDDGAELAKLTRAAPGATLCCRLATSGLGADYPLSSKFGCPPSDALGLLTAATVAGHPVGVAFHVGSQQRDPDRWDAPLAAVGRLQARLAASGVELSVLNIGGGFPGSYRQPAAPIEDYGRAIADALDRHVRGPVRLLAEPGRFLVADSGVIETEVVLVARRGDERWVYLDVGLFGGLVETLDEAIEYRIETSRDGGATGPVVLAGPTCDSVDVLYRSAGYQLPLALAAGDRVRLLSTGAYTATYSSVGFNGFPPLAVRFRSASPAPRQNVTVSDRRPVTTV